MDNISKNKSIDDDGAGAESSDVVWGAAAIGNLINRSPAQVYYLHRRGMLMGAAAKIGAKTFVGSRRRLEALHLAKLK